jgi:probable HAF family extracellular repeat protein
MTGGNAWQPWDINEKGEIVGALSTAYYFDGTTTVWTTGLATTNLSYSGLFGINNVGLAVGASTVGTNFPGLSRAFAFNLKTKAVRNLGTLLPSGESAARAVNDAGLIVGSSATTNGTRAVRFEPDGRITDLGTLGGNWSAASDINERGDIVGSSYNSQESTRAFLLPAGGTMIDLGTLGGSNSWASRINNRGEIVGTSETGNDGAHAFLYADGKMLDLGTLGGPLSAAFGINDEGVVVGWAQKTYTDWTAFVKYPGGAMRDLGSMVSVPGDDWLVSARAINNRGEIAATIFHPTYRTGVEFTSLLKPGSMSGAVRNGHWELDVAIPPGRAAVLERSNDLRDWLPIFTLEGEGNRAHREPVEPGHRFFRIVSD